MPTQVRHLTDACIHDARISAFYTTTEPSPGVNRRVVLEGGSSSSASLS
jgi:hypothetical protein